MSLSLKKCKIGVECRCVYVNVYFVGQNILIHHYVNILVVITDIKTRHTKQ